MEGFEADPGALVEAAEVLKAMAHPVRLCLVIGLSRTGGCIVSQMQRCLGAPQATISQHLTKLKAAGIVRANRTGTQVRYEVSSDLARSVAELIMTSRSR